MMFRDQVIRTPVNRTAALVSCQSGCEDSMSLDDKRDSLARAIEHIQREILGLPKKHRYRKELGQKKSVLQTEISSINKKIKMRNARDVDLDKYIIFACRRAFTSQRWNEILCEARGDKKAADNFGESGDK